MPEAVLAGIPTAWRVIGDGPVHALALHCSLAHGGTWIGFSAGLQGVSLTVPDLLGHGRSGDWDGVSDFHSLATRQAMAVLAAVPEGPVHLIGHSFGATVALRMALENPDRIASLTLMDSVLFCAARAAGGPAFGDHIAQHAGFAEALAAGNALAATEAFQAIWGGGRPFDSLPPAQRGYIVQRIGLIAAQNPVLNDDAAGILAYGRLEGLGVPVLLLQGAESPAIIDAINAELARRLPQVTRATVAGAGHMLPISHAADCAVRVQAFWAQIANAL
ncbi:alpha/beta fold hydrolase [Pseudorhodobacter ferrugineus]|uniref:alpha/beta fold hydrolase n=1 Tax=Pseudorhodobacter ferrugineus TaxID=77008 RepID=UPI0003B2EB45|nr:alpha/beta fold hydrolase [Pseudorhodobacter ferrugineus]